VADAQTAYGVLLVAQVDEGVVAHVLGRLGVLGLDVLLELGPLDAPVALLARS